jgi:hypothetical protein
VTLNRAGRRCNAGDIWKLFGFASIQSSNFSDGRHPFASTCTGAIGDRKLAARSPLSEAAMTGLFFL